MDEDLKLGKVSAGTVSRVIMLFISIFNELAVSYGWYVITVTDEDVTKAVSLIFMVIMAVICMWKNNSFTQAAIQGDEVMQAEKDGMDVEVYITDPNAEE